MIGKKWQSYFRGSQTVVFTELIEKPYLCKTKRFGNVSFRGNQEWYLDHTESEQMKNLHLYFPYLR